MRYRVPKQLVTRTFEHFRNCGRGAHECQVLWTSPWEQHLEISEVIHSQHNAHAGGFELEGAWLHQIWLDLGRKCQGIRVQVHTHPHAAFHSDIDDRFPVIHSVGFLSLVIPDFGLGPIGFERAYLAEIDGNGRWRRVQIPSRIEVIDE